MALDDINGQTYSDPETGYPTISLVDKSTKATRQHDPKDKDLGFSFQQKEDGKLQCDAHLDGNSDFKNITLACVDVKVKDTDPTFKLAHYYGVNSADINSDKTHNKNTIREDAEKIAEYLKNHPEKSLSIEGHASYTGTAEGNMTLSKDRANSYNEALLAELKNINSDYASRVHVQKEFKGSTDPIIDTKAEDYRNRTVIIKAYDTESTGKVNKVDFNFHLDKSDMSRIQYEGGVVTVDGRMGSDLGEKFKNELKTPVAATNVALTVSPTEMNKPITINFTGEYKLVIDDPYAKIDYKFTSDKSVEVSVNGKKFADLNYNLEDGKKLTPEMVHISTKEVVNGKVEHHEYKKDFLTSALKSADLDNSGTISQGEYKQAMENIKLRAGVDVSSSGKSLSDEERAKYGMAAADIKDPKIINGTGNLDLDEKMRQAQVVSNIAGMDYKEKFMVAVKDVNNITEQLAKDQAFVESFSSIAFKQIPAAGLSFADISRNSRENLALSDEKAGNNASKDKDETRKP